MQKDEAVLNVNCQTPKYVHNKKLARVAPFKDRKDLTGLCEQVAQTAYLCLFSFCTAYITRYTPTHTTSEPRSLTVTSWRPKKFPRGSALCYAGMYWIDVA
jgi:hypothetical protein